MKEKLQEYALIAEIIGGIAIVASLVFVGIEIQQGSEETAQNTRAIEVNAYQELIGQLDSFTSRAMEDPTLQILVMSGTTTAKLSREQRTQVTSYFYNIVRHADLAFYQYEMEMLTQQRMESAIGPLNDRICLSLFNDFWADSKHNFVLNFSEYIDAKMKQC